MWWSNGVSWPCGSTPPSSRDTSDHAPLTVTVKAGVQPLYKQALQGGREPIQVDCVARRGLSSTTAGVPPPYKQALPCLRTCTSPTDGGRRLSLGPTERGVPGLPSTSLHDTCATLALGDNQGLESGGRSSLPGRNLSGSTLTRPTRETRDAKPRLGLGIFEAFTRK